MKFGTRQIAKAFNDPIRSFQAVQILRQGTLFLASIILARSHFSLQEIGAYEWLVYLGFTFSFFWAAGFLQGLLTIHSIKDLESKSAFIWSVFSLFIIFGTILWLVFLVLSILQPGDYPVKSQEYLLYGSWLLLSLPAMMTPFLLYIKGHTKSLHLFNGCYFLGYIAVFTFVWWEESSLTVLLLLLVLFGLFQFIWLSVVLPKLDYALLTWKSILKTFKEFWPLTGYALMGGLALAFDGWLVHYLYGDGEDFAIYKYGSRELPLSLALAAALSNAMIPLISESLSQSLKILKIRSTRLMHLLFPVSILLLLGSNWLFNFLYGPRFSEAILIFDIMLLLVISRLVFPQTLLVALKDNAYLFKVSILEFLVNVVGSIVLVIYFGIPGIVMASILAYGVEKLVYVIYLNRKHGIPFGRFTNVQIWSLYSLLLVGVFIFKYGIR